MCLLILGLIDLDLQFYFKTSNLLFSTKLCVSYSFASFCMYLVKPSPVSVPHPTWLRRYTDSYARHGPWNSLPLYLSETIGVQPALDFTSCYRFSPYDIRFARRRFICQLSSITDTTVKQHPLAFILFDFQSGISCISAIFSAGNTNVNTGYHILACILVLSRYAHHQWRVMGRELWKRLGDSGTFYFQTWSLEYRAEILFKATIRHRTS